MAVPNVLEKGDAALVLDQWSWNGGTSMPKGPGKGIVLGVWLFNKGAYSSCLIWGKVSIFHVNVG